MNAEGKKIHCVPDPERVYNAQNMENSMTDMQQQQHQHHQHNQVMNLQHHLDELANRLHSSNDLSNHTYNAASVISSLALGDPQDYGSITHEQAIQAVQHLAQQHHRSVRRHLDSDTHHIELAHATTLLRE